MCNSTLGFLKKKKTHLICFWWFQPLLLLQASALSSLAVPLQLWPFSAGQTCVQSFIKSTRLPPPPPYGTSPTKREWDYPPPPKKTAIRRRPPNFQKGHRPFANQQPAPSIYGFHKLHSPLLYFNLFFRKRRTSRKTARRIVNFT